MNLGKRQPAFSTLLLCSVFWSGAVRILAGEPVRGQPIGGEPSISSSSATNAGPTAATISPAAAPKTNSSAPAAAPAGGAKGEKYLPAGFDILSGFKLEMAVDTPVSGDAAKAASAKVMGQVPAAVKTLNERQVAARGFMLPMKVESGMVTEFILLKSQMGCCYGMSPGINEWIDVQTSGKGVRSQMDDLITVYGTLHVKDVWESGYLTGIYKMDCERVE